MRDRGREEERGRRGEGTTDGGETSPTLHSQSTGHFREKMNLIRRQEHIQRAKKTLQLHLEEYRQRGKLQAG